MKNKSFISIAVLLAVLFSAAGTVLFSAPVSADSFDDVEWRNVHTEDFEGTGGHKWWGCFDDYDGNIWRVSPPSATNNTGDSLDTQVLRIPQSSKVYRELLVVTDAEKTFYAGTSDEVAGGNPYLKAGYSESQLGMVRLSLNIMKDATDRTTNVQLVGKKNGEIVKQARTVGFHKDGKIYINGTSQEYGRRSMGNYTANKWYKIVMEINCLTDTYKVGITSGSSMTWLDEDGLDCDFDCILGIDVIAKKEGSETTKITYVDNIKFDLLEPEVFTEPEMTFVPGTGGYSDYFKISADMGSGAAEVPANSKAYIALYGQSGKLLDLDIADFASSLETKYFRKSYNGAEPAYAKLFVWEGMRPVMPALSSQIVIPETTYDYPMENRTILSGAIRAFDNIYTLAETEDHGAIIPVDVSLYDTVTLTRGENDLKYAFLAAEPEIFINSNKFPEGFTPSFAAGYTKVNSTTHSTKTVPIPYNARYLYIFNNSGNTSYVPSAITFSKSGNTSAPDPDSIKIATWNIGHYSLGEHSYSDVTSSDFAVKRAEYEDYIYNVLGADVIGLNEYSAEFVRNSTNARTTIFSGYTTAYEGEQRQYSCNALYGKSGLLSNITAHDFNCNIAAGGSGVAKPSNYYYVTADLMVNGKVVKLVSVHLVYTDPTTTSTMPEQQIDELIEVMSGYDRVILMGDWNSAFTHFDRFVQAGYSLANESYWLSTYGPCQGSRYYSSYMDYKEGSYDNIIYKGVTVGDFGLGGTKLSDHYGIYCTVTVDEIN